MTEHDIQPDLPQENMLPDLPQTVPPRSFSEFVRECVNFARKPSYALPHTFSSLEGAKVLAFALLFDYLLMFCSLILIGAVVGKDLVQENHQMQEMIESYSPILIFAFVALLAPLLEETIFRLFLRFHTLNLLFSLLFAAFFFVPRASGWVFWLALGVFLFVFLGLLMLYLNAKDAVKDLEIFWERNFSTLYYLSVFSFGLIHILNYSLPFWKALVLAPVLVLPQILLGFILGYLRMRYHFGFALALHAIHNGILIIPTLIFKDLILGN